MLVMFTTYFVRKMQFPHLASNVGWHFVRNMKLAKLLLGAQPFGWKLNLLITKGKALPISCQDHNSALAHR